MSSASVFILNITADCADSRLANSSKQRAYRQKTANLSDSKNLAQDML